MVLTVLVYEKLSSYTSLVDETLLPTTPKVSTDLSVSCICVFNEMRSSMHPTHRHAVPVSSSLSLCQHPCPSACPCSPSWPILSLNRMEKTLLIMTVSHPFALFIIACDYDLFMLPFDAALYTSARHSGAMLSREDLLATIGVPIYRIASWSLRSPGEAPRCAPGCPRSTPLSPRSLGWPWLLP